MTERKKDLIYIVALLVVIILCFSKILFTAKIIRAPDIISEAYWWMKIYNDKQLSELYSLNLKATWDLLINSGHTNEGGMTSIQFLLYLPLILHFIPAPASVAWFIVLHLFFGACGVYCYCRLIGTSRIAALLGALIFALATENASLINAGHVMKIATIAYAPWAFYCLEKGFLRRRLFWFMATAMVLSFQFFNTHWQIAFYTCLCVGLYGVLRSIGIILSPAEQEKFSIKRLAACNIAVLIFFLTTVSISLAPLANWSKDTNRGVQSGANQGKGGLDRDEAMSWSLPPEETAAFIIPGFFGFSRQEAGLNPDNIISYYWGRMVFTQTASYMGLIPWLLIPLPLIYRRDKYTKLALIGIVAGILFSMGKYTPFYNFLFDYFPGINRFRVPKMMMFIPVIGLGILSARGLDPLVNKEIRETKNFRLYLTGITAVPILLLAFLGMLHVGQNTWVNMFHDFLSSPTRYEQGAYLIEQRWNNILLETSIAAVLAAICAWLIIFGNKLRNAAIIPLLLIGIFLADSWRVNSKFLFLVDPPKREITANNPVVGFIARDSNQYRTLPVDGSDPMMFVSNGIPVMFTSNAVQQQRWQNFLNIFNLNSRLPDMLNVKYLTYSTTQYTQDKLQLFEKYRPVFVTPDQKQLILENRGVLPKAWLVSSAIVANASKTIEILQHPAFDPANTALIETPPPIQLDGDIQSTAKAGWVGVKKYTGEQIIIEAEVFKNALMISGEKYNNGWLAYVDGVKTQIVPVNHILRGVYLTPGKHVVEFRFDPLPFKIGKYLTLTSFTLFAVMLWREWSGRKQRSGTREQQRPSFSHET